MSGAAGGGGGAGGGKGGGGCRVCGVKGELQQCSRCHGVQYCGPECQKKDWKEAHKTECAQLAKEYAREKVASSNERNVRGQFAGSRREIERALQVQREHKSSERDVGLSLVKLGHVLREEGKFEEALARHEEALGLFQKLSEENTDPVDRQALRLGMAKALAGIGGVYNEQGRQDTALEKLQESLRIHVDVLGPEGIDVDVTLNCIGTSYTKQGKHSEALKSHKEALRIAKKRWGPEHPNVGTMLNNIGNSYRAQGKLSKALNRYEEALRIAKMNLGKDHPHLANSITNMGLVYREQGRDLEALEAFQEALRISKKMLGHEHPNVAFALHNMGLLYASQGKRSEALEALEEALRIRKKVFGGQDPLVSQTHLDFFMARETVGVP